MLRPDRLPATMSQHVVDQALQQSPVQKVRTVLLTKASSVDPSVEARLVELQQQVAMGSPDRTAPESLDTVLESVAALAAGEVRFCEIRCLLAAYSLSVQHALDSPGTVPADAFNLVGRRSAPGKRGGAAAPEPPPLVARPHDVGLGEVGSAGAVRTASSRKGSTDGIGLAGSSAGRGFGSAQPVTRSFAAASPAARGGGAGGAMASGTASGAASSGGLKQHKE